ncbi:MAG: flagellar hook-length control protein FliK [Piscirickettsiaceae bacterium]|nr:flagellar hook-length control protein FliK [Piscirickettsiaceae bacterium]
MLIQQSIQNTLMVVNDIPNQLLAGLSVGQRIDAIVMTSAQAAQIVTLKVTDSLMEIRSPTSLKQGDIVQLEVIQLGNKIALKLVVSTSDAQAIVKPLAPIPLKVGQQIAVEVIKVLTENRLLVEAKPNSARVAQTQAVPQIFDIDVSQLAKSPKLTDKLVMNIVSVKPLAIQLVSEPKLREQIVLERIRQLLPQLPNMPKISRLVDALKIGNIPDTVKHEGNQLLQNIVDKSAVNKPQILKQALQHSGSFTEKQLITRPELAIRDFKSNLLKLLQVLESEIAKKSISLSGTNAKSPLPITPLTSSSQAMMIAQLLGQKGFTEQARNSPPELLILQSLLRETEGVHNKLQFNQLTMLKEPDALVTASWLLDLPLKDKSGVDIMQIQIDQHKKQSESDEGDIWSVKLRLDTQNLGPVQATVTMHSDDVKIVVRAEREASAELLEEHLPVLQQALDKLTISVSHLSCACGEISKRILTESYVETDNSLVDISV